MSEQKYLTKEDINNIVVNSPIRITKKAIRIGQKITNQIGVDFQKFLSSIGLGYQKYTKEEISKANSWKVFSVNQKEIIANENWIALNSDKKREIIKDRLGVVSEIKIDEWIEKFNSYADFFENQDFENKDFEKLENISRELEEEAKQFDRAEIFLKIARLFMDQYNEENDTYGELFLEVIDLLNDSTGVQKDILINSSVELLLELVIRIFLKTQKEVDDSFFIKRAINLFLEYINTLRTTGIGN